MITQKLYEADGSIREFVAKVISCAPARKGAPQDAAYEIILDQTAFFPEGGGQYADSGNLGNACVVDVQELDGEIIHFTDVPLPEGESVMGLLNWEDRL
ncbi:MAG: hypothetical protein IJC75_00545, partial [Oscillospiraceae bacterium]|nr:hypothetical protein [Oscillospiraceae bacterium]